MSSYKMYFDSGTTKLVLPTNPEELEINSVQANEKFEVLKLGQIVIPIHMELKEYSFECEFPHAPISYIETPNYFITPDEYIAIFEAWHNHKKPMWFVASNGIGEPIRTKVLIESMSITEKAGEEGDKYISFKLIEYKDYKSYDKTNELVVRTATNTAKKLLSAKPTDNPKKPSTYTIIKGDTLYGIAKRFYGDGSQYTKVYNANKAIIKNPNLIYPGQVITLP